MNDSVNSMSGGIIMYSSATKSPAARRSHNCAWKCDGEIVNASDAAREDLRTVVHGPARYRRDIEERRPGSFVPLRAEEVRPVELVIRVDHAMDRSLADIRGFEQSSGVAGAPVEPDVSRRVIEADEDLDV